MDYEAESAEIARLKKSLAFVIRLLKESYSAHCETRSILRLAITALESGNQEMREIALQLVPDIGEK